jgi:photosynthetic reaction center H subunit
MHAGAVTSFIDVAQLTLYAFWIFFAGLIVYLRREDRREGYPLINTDNLPRIGAQIYPGLPKPKTFLLHDGTTRLAPRPEPREVIAAQQVENWQGAPYEPTGNPMVDGIGPAAYANRPDEPDLAFDDQKPKIVPLREAADFFLAFEDPDPRGMVVLGADGLRAGVIVDAWVDRAEVTIRYLEAELDAEFGARRVLVPMNMTDVRGKAREIRVFAISAAQFATVPALKRPDIVTLLEEDKIMGYYGGGMLYGLPGRMGPIL